MDNCTTGESIASARANGVSAVTDPQQRLNMLSLGLVLVIAGIVGLLVFQTATSPELATYINQSAEWCNNHGGELVKPLPIGNHGGLHCDLPNGTSVHMHDVVNVTDS